MMAVLIFASRPALRYNVQVFWLCLHTFSADYYTFAWCLFCAYYQINGDSILF